MVSHVGIRCSNVAFASSSVRTKPSPKTTPRTYRDILRKRCPALTRSLADSVLVNEQSKLTFIPRPSGLSVEWLRERQPSLIEHARGKETTNGMPTDTGAERIKVPAVPDQSVGHERSANGHADLDRQHGSAALGAGVSCGKERADSKITES